MEATLRIHCRSNKHCGLPPTIAQVHRQVLPIEFVFSTKMQQYGKCKKQAAKLVTNNILIYVIDKRFPSPKS